MTIFIITIAWLLGIIWGLYFKLGIVLLVFVSLFLFIWRRENRYAKIIITKPYIFLFMICCSLSFIQITQLEKSFQNKYQNVQEEIEVLGTIIANPSTKEYQTIYTIKVESINGDTSYQNTKLLLKVKREKEEKKYDYGNQILLKGIFEKPRTQRNTGGFDYAKYLKTKRIYGIVSAKTKDIQLKKENKANKIEKLANTVANKIEEKTNELLKPKEAHLLTGILIGKKENLEEEIEENFRKSSLSHILAVSGMHVSYLLVGITFLQKKAKGNKKWKKIGTILFLLFFVKMTGETPSVLRACLMTIYGILGTLLHKKVSTLISLFLSMFLLILFHPYCIFDVGFQLSYGGTIGILLLYPQIKLWLKNKKEQKQERIKEIIGVTLSANLILIPIILYHYNTLSLNFLLSNLLVSPLIGILIFLGIITIFLAFLFPFMGKILSFPLQCCLMLFLEIVQWLSKLPFSQIKLATPKKEIIFLYYFLLFLFFFYQKRKHKRKKRRIEKKIIQQQKKITKKKIILCIFVILILPLVSKQIPKELDISFIDVGQGDSMLIVTPQKKTILVDGGGAKEKEIFNVGKETLLPYLLDRQITKLDYIFISHFDTDHVRFYFIFIARNKSKKCYYRKAI